MADDVSQFIAEAHIFVGDPAVEEMKGVVNQASQLIQTLFRRFDLTGKSSRSQAISYSDYGSLAKLNKALTVGILLPKFLSPERNIPDNIYCLGPYWLEDWSDRQIEEQFNFARWGMEQQSQIQQLLKLLGVIQNQPQLPKKLKQAAKEVYRLLRPESEDSEEHSQEYSTLQTTQSRHLAIAVPVDYVQFWRRDPGEEQSLSESLFERQTVIEEPLLWRNGLGRCLGDWQLVMPIIAEYESFPWAAVVDKQTLYQPQRLFDKRYFVTSYELNLLNLILFEEAE
jgi:hypothetical protein